METQGFKLEMLLQGGFQIIVSAIECKYREENNEINQGPLKIWTEHSNFLLQGRGDTKTPIAILKKNVKILS